MTLADLILGPLYFGIVFFLAKMFEKKLVIGAEEKHFYIRAFLLKIIGVTAFAFIYEFYYRGGDTMGFYTWSQAFLDYLINDFSSAISFLFTDSPEAFSKFKYNYGSPKYSYILKYNTREAIFIKMTSIINLLSMNTYLSTSYVFALISFVGNWLLYKVFIYHYPKIKKELAYAVLFIPSVSFWGTGILKDTLTFSALCFLVYALHKAFIVGENKVRNIFVIIFMAYLIMTLKAYILLAFLPAGVVWVFNEKKSKIKSGAMRALLTPIFFLMIMATLGGLVLMLGESAGRFSISSLEQTTKDFQGWHAVASENGSGYTIHSTGTSVTSLLTAFPESINVTYFRPYLWESGSIVVLMGAMESLFLLLYFLKIIIFKGKIIIFFRAIFSKPIIQMSLIFALFFGFVVGFTSFNFGALARYKVPSMPFFVAFLVMVSHQIDILKGNVKEI
jgi:hypothetical protein